MESTAVAPQEYWGYLIKPDKSPSPVLEQLLLGVANYIVRYLIASLWACNLLCMTQPLTIFHSSEFSHCPVEPSMSDAGEARCLLPARRRRLRSPVPRYL